MTRGSVGSGNSPLAMWRSVRQTAQTDTRIGPWPGPGVGIGSSTRRSGCLAASSCIAFMVSPLGGDPALQRCVEADRRAGQRLRDGTVLLRLVGEALEGCLIDARHVAFGRQIDPGDSPALVALIEMHACRSPNFLWLLAGLCEPIGERHRKAAGMSRANQLFRVRAGAFLHP